MNAGRFVLFFLLFTSVAPLSYAEIKHVEMRVEGMT